MSAAVFGIVLAAAFMHALWNAIVKGAGDRALVLGLIALGHVVPAVGLLFYTGFPIAESLPYIVASTVIHWGYYWFLFVAYRSGELSVVYPISRGVAPLLIAVGAWALVGEALPLAGWLGILAISGGISFLALGGISHATSLGAIGAALATGAIIAAYSLADGIGVRVSGDPLAYIALLFACEIFVAAYIFGTKWQRLRALPRSTVIAGFSGGVISASAYGLVLYAKTLAPLGVVSALRETSVIFAALIGVMWFGERPRGRRMAAAGIVAGGIVVLGAAT